MTYDARVVEVMIASPGEVADERRMVRDILASWNNLHARERRVVLLPVSWETHSSPDLSGRAQQIINDRVLSGSDLVIGIFWTKIGSPTGKEESGTVEEIKEHHAAGKPVMLYFSNAPIPQDRLDHDQFVKVQALKMWALEQGLVGNYDSADDFRAKLRDQLHIILRDNPYLKAETNVDLTAESVAVTPSRPSKPSPEAMQLIRAAAEDDSGSVIISKSIDKPYVQAGRQVFGKESQRELARWLAAIHDLYFTFSYLRDVGGTGEVYQVTDAGYRLIEDAAG
jgi:hypothetical protein